MRYITVISVCVLKLVGDVVLLYILLKMFLVFSCSLFLFLIGTPNRKYFNWIHWWCGRALIILGIINVSLT